MTNINLLDFKNDVLNVIGDSNRDQYPYKWLWDYAGDNYFEAEGEIKFSLV